MKLWLFHSYVTMFVYKRVYTTKQQKLDVPIKIVSPGMFFCMGERRVSPHFPTIVVATNKKRIPLLPFRVPNLSVVSMRQEIPNWLDHRPNLRPTSARLLSTSPAHKTVSMRRLKPSTRPTPMSGGIPKPARGPRHRGFIAVIQHPKGSGSPETNKWGLEV